MPMDRKQVRARLHAIHDELVQLAKETALYEESDAWVDSASLSVFEALRMDRIVSRGLDPVSTCSAPVVFVGLPEPVRLPNLAPPLGMHDRLPGGSTPEEWPS